MAIKSRITNLERKINVNQKEIIVVFSEKGRYLVKRDGRGEVNKIFKHIDEINDYYKDRNTLKIIFSNVYKIDDELKANISNNIKTIETNIDEEFDYEKQIELVKQKAKELETL